MMGNFPMYARISARVHESEKEKLKNSGYSAREAIEYFNKIVNTDIDSLKIEEFFLNKEIEDLKEELICKEMKLENIQKQKDELYVGTLSELRVNSNQKIISMYGINAKSKYNELESTVSRGESFEKFIQGTYIQEVISQEVSVNNCTFEEFEEGLINYYEDVIKVGMTK